MGELEQLEVYLKSARVNLNIRQVFPTGERNKFLTDEKRKELLHNAMERAGGKKVNGRIIIII